MDHYILLLNYLSNYMHFITNSFKCFSTTNSSNPRQRVPLMVRVMKDRVRLGTKGVGLGLGNG